MSVGCEPKARLTIRTVDDLGNPVPGATVDVAFEHHLNPNSFTLKSGVSNAQGEFTAEHRTSGYITYGADKSGFYSSNGKWETIVQPKGGKWSPWNPTIDLVMRPILSPVPLLTKTIELRDVPIIGEGAFDVVKGEWLPPLGKGTSPDFRFEWKGEWRGINDNEGELALSFSNPGDGLIPQPYSYNSGSELRLFHKAPAEGYADSRRWRDEFKNPPDHPVRIVVSDVREDIAYFFRVRMITNSSDGNITALYGKIEGDIAYFGAGRRGSGLRFKYYLNPTPNDRNLEYDGTNNLFDARQPAGR
jgi:hypothetical protein